MADAKHVLDQLPDDLQQEVVDFAEFLLAKARMCGSVSSPSDSAGAAPTKEQGEAEGPWDSLVASLEQFSEDYMADRRQPGQQPREAM